MAIRLKHSAPSPNPELIRLTGTLEGVDIFPVALRAPFPKVAARFADRPGAVVLLSGGDLDCARYHLLAIDPWLRVNGRCTGIRIETDAGSLDWPGDPFDGLRRVIDTYRIDGIDPSIPVAAGLFGYLAYDLKDVIETLPRTVMDDLGLPDLCLFAPSVVVVHDKATGATHACVTRRRTETGPKTADIVRLKSLLEAPAAGAGVNDDLRASPSPRNASGEAGGSGHSRIQIDAVDANAINVGGDSGQPTFIPKDLSFAAFHSPAGTAGGLETSGMTVAAEFQSSFTRNAYLEAVGRIKEYILSGHIYQVNLSQRFETGFSGDPYALFASLYESAPAPFYAYVHAGDHWIISTSPEGFLRRRGTYVETRPIKGTRPRGADPDEDAALAKELKTSPKDDAELSMIVDLMRNDLGRVCEGGSVAVAEHKRLEAYRNVFHLVSVVTGTLRPDADAVDLIRATFPGGSITGCPRIRAMEIIDELEPCRRHVYTGAMGYIGFHDTMDLNIAIRTATVFGDRVYFSVGGGVVQDSDPADEYEETLHKGKTLTAKLQTGPAAFDAAAPTYVWQNGVMKPRSEAAVSIDDLGLTYGYGFFETLRADNGRPSFLADHMERFGRAWESLFQTPAPDLTWDDIIRQVIDANGLSNGMAAIKIMATFGAGAGPPYRHGLVVSARNYQPRPALAEKGGLDLAVYPHPRQTPMADHKTFNYLYYYLAGQWARHQGADEALITNPDGSISETNTANILVIRGNTLVQPHSAHVLPGVMEKQVIRCLEGQGYEIVTRRLALEDLFTADGGVILTNSLIGAVSVLSIDGKPLRHCDALINGVCTAVLKSGV
jgi:para-aminobenzoate synthetase component I